MTTIAATHHRAGTLPSCEKDCARLRIVLLLLLVPWCCDCVRIAWQGVESAATPVATCLTELHILHGIQQVAEGNELYPKIDGLPLTFHYYNPMTYLPAGLAGRWLGLDFDGLLVAGRILPLLASLGIAALLGAYVWSRCRDWWLVALAASMLFFFHSTTLTDFFRNRPETPGLLLTLAGWVIVQLRPRRWPVLAALMFIAAISFKQTFVAAPIVCGLQLCVAREWRNLAKLVGTSVAAGLAMIAASWFWLGDGYFQHTVFAMKSNPVDPIAGAKLFFPILIHAHWGLLLPATLVSVASLVALRKERPLLMYLGVCFVLTCIAHGKVGADLNYHVELSTLMVLTTAVAIAQLFAVRSLWAYCPVALLLLGTWLAIFQHGPLGNNISYYRFLRSHAYAGPPQSKAAVYADMFKQYRGRVLITDDEIAIRVGSPVAYDWYALQYFFASGHVGFDVLRQAIMAKQFDAIVLRKDKVAVGRDGSPAFPFQQRIEAAALAAGYQCRWQDANFLELAPG